MARAVHIRLLQLLELRLFRPAFGFDRHKLPVRPKAAGASDVEAAHTGDHRQLADPRRVQVRERALALVVRLAGLGAAGGHLVLYISADHVPDRLFQRHDQKASFLEYCSFVAFFPQLLAGPITTHAEFKPHEGFSLRSRLLSMGLSLFLFGLFKKTILSDGLEDTRSPSFIESPAA